ncbi:aryl-sulfate sulfotransferase [Peristeroidobacter agariperforans]|uniref:hypothetical protein n=1 Tax=Peristeroidobacter agariperforans TaxID=268404 RepID=UPI00101BFBEB|nr:hypothetical protein [Peristeroidobacter agariperforans]
MIAKVNEEALLYAPGWRLVIGGFQVDGTFVQSALLFSPEMTLTRVVKFKDMEIAGKKSRSTGRLFIHGFSILNDGSMIVTFDGGAAIQRFDACGKRMWSTAGDFSHAVTLEEDQEYVWTIRDMDGLPLSAAVQLTTATGKIVRQISMLDVIRRNPDVDILSVNQRDNNLPGDNPKAAPPEWYGDPFHLNDVDPLPHSMAPAFPSYTDKDVLISARALGNPPVYSCSQKWKGTKQPSPTSVSA